MIENNDTTAPAQPEELFLASLDKWLYQALHASWGAVTAEPLPAELVAIIQGQGGNSAPQPPRIALPCQGLPMERSIAA